VGRRLALSLFCAFSTSPGSNRGVVSDNIFQPQQNGSAIVFFSFFLCLWSEVGGFAASSADQIQRKGARRS